MLKNKTLSIIIPCFNEEKTLEKILFKILDQKFIKKQILIVDDCSTDSSREIILKNKKYFDKYIFHKKNYGKGACIISAQNYINGDVVLIQDADLEYDPNDYKKLILPIINKNFMVVYGSRVLSKNKDQLYKNFFSPNIRVLGNYLLTRISNYINNQSLTDAHTCYKVFDAKLFKNFKLKRTDFAFCPEVTSLVSKLNLKIKEIPISYNGRGYLDGKKINFFDAFKALFVLLKLRFF